MLIAVDALNVLYETTPYPFNGQMLKGSQLSIPAAFQCVGPDGFKCVESAPLPPPPLLRTASPRCFRPTAAGRSSR